MVAWGSVYALVALGHAMAFRVLRLVNFAHRHVYMLGACLCLCAARWVGAAHNPSPAKAIGVLLASEGAGPGGS